jgi:hypothetical protein
MEKREMNLFEKKDKSEEKQKEKPVLSQAKIITKEEFEQIEQGPEHFIQEANKLRDIILKLTKPNDWIIYNNKPFLQSYGAERIAFRLGISVTNIKDEFINLGDGHYMIKYQGTFSHPKLGSLEAVGFCSTKDKFFGRQDIQDINIVNIALKAYTTMYRNGITRLLGLRNLTLDELKNYGIDITKLQVINFK